MRDRSTALVRDAEWLLDNVSKPPPDLLVKFAHEHELLNVHEGIFCNKTAGIISLPPPQERKRVAINARILHRFFKPMSSAAEAAPPAQSAPAAPAPPARQVISRRGESEYLNEFHRQHSERAKEAIARQPR